jgi:hypothetical protein
MKNLPKILVRIRSIRSDLPHEIASIRINTAVQRGMIPRVTHRVILESELMPYVF